MIFPSSLSGSRSNFQGRRSIIVHLSLLRFVLKWIHAIKHSKTYTKPQSQSFPQPQLFAKLERVVFLLKWGLFACRKEIGKDYKSTT